MSLLFRRRAIHDAVAGTLPEPALGKLRAHLLTCAKCRAHYDALSAITGLSKARTDARASAERARLLAALDAPAGPTKLSVPRWAWAIPAGVAIAAVVVLSMRPTRQPDDDGIAWRGPTPNEPAAPLHLVLYASRKPAAAGGAPGPLRRIGDFPGAGEAKVSREDYLQFGYARLDAPAHLLIAGLDDRGSVYQYLPRGKSAPAPASRGVKSLGPSLDVAAAQGPGRVRLFAFAGRAPVDERAVRAALEGLHRSADRKSVRLPGGGVPDTTYVAGVLEVVP